MNDILREIDDELQRERMAALWHKHKFLIVGLLAAVIFLTASISAWRDHRTATEVRNSLALGTIGENASLDEAGKAEAFLGFARDHQGTGQADIATLMAIGIKRDLGKKDQVLQDLAALAANDKARPLVRDYARLLRVQLRLDSEDIALLRQELAPLAADGQPWRYTARLLQGSLFLRGGETKTAQEVFGAIANDATAPIAARDSARLMLQSLRGQE
jgi:hypothetical protein